jgi:ribosomal protein S18 acetylase RimI-like enzyme
VTRRVILKKLNSLNFEELSIDEIKELNSDRAIHLEKSTNGMMAEPPILCPIINDLRYNYGFWYLRPFLINNDGLKFEISTYNKDKRIHLAFIGVPHEKRQNGYGTQMMKALTEISDKYGYTIDLEVDPRFGTGKRILIRFYKSFGFVKDTRDFRGNNAMIRWSQ